MKPPKASHSFKSFQDLEVLIKNRSLPARREVAPEKVEIAESPESEEKMFKKAMEGVKPIPKDKTVLKRACIEPPEATRNNEDAETLEKLSNLVRYGTGFTVSDTPEYIEGTGYHVFPSVAKRLHRGDFSIQAHIDLHGLGVDEARETFEKFLHWAVTTGRRGVLIIHGRGLSSPSEPILKNKVKEWLTRGPWRKWVVAYCSARKCDGGAGATYVLLRQRPVSKRSKVRKKGRPE